MASIATRPPLRDLFAGPDERRAAFQYWVLDSFYGGVKWVLYHLFRYLPIDWCSDIGAFVSRFTRHSYPESEQRARKLWAQLNPARADTASSDAAMDRLWRNISRTIGEFPVLHRLWDEGRIRVEGAEHLAKARASGKPLLITPLHLANWEIAPVTIAALGVRCVGFYLPPDNRFEHAIAIKSRIGYGAVPVATTRHNMREALRELKTDPGQFVIFIDEYINDRVHAPAFGRPLQPLGNIAFVARLAVKTGAIVQPVFTVREGDAARFTVTFLPPVDLVHDGDRDEALMENIRRLDATIAPIIARHMDQWFYALDFEFDADVTPEAASH